VHVEGDRGIGPHGFEQARHITRGHRVIGFGAPVFTCVAEIGHQRGHTRGPAIFECADEKQQAAKLVVGALLWSAVKALQHEDIRAANRLEGTRFMLPILKFALFVRSQGPAQRGRNCGAQFGSRMQGK